MVDIIFIKTLKDFRRYLPSFRKGCYIAGPITGVPDYKKKFIDAEKFLGKYEIPAWNPGYHPEGFPYDSYFPVCFAMMRNCECMLMLDGWQNSVGAIRELDYAKEIVRDRNRPYYVIDYEKVRMDGISDRNYDVEIGFVLGGGCPYGCIPVDRSRCEPEMAKLFAELGVDNNVGEGFENHVFALRPYKGTEPEMGKEPLPNFEYKVNGFKVWWYKRAMRNAFADKDIPFSEYREMIADCIRSLKPMEGEAK